jgi:hypothetical protein
MQGDIEQIITISGQRTMECNCITSVYSFNPSQIVLSYKGGRIAVYGSNLKITSFSNTSGKFTAEGVVTQVRYIGAGGLKTKLFK